MTATSNPKSTGEMVNEILANISSLVRNEADLARTEIAEDMRRVAASFGTIALALLMAITGLNVLATSLVALVIWAGLSPLWATVLVGTGLLLIAMILFYSAKSALHHIGFVPTRAAQNLKRDAATIKDTFHDK